MPDLPNMEKEPFKYKHAKSSWMSAVENLAIAEEIAAAGLAAGNLEEYMAEGGYSVYVAEVGAPPAGQGNFITAVPAIYAVYNALELIAKGYEYVAFPDDRLGKILRFLELVEAFNQRAYAAEQPVAALYHKYLNDETIPGLLHEFLQAQGKDVASILATRRFLAQNNYFNAMEDYEAFYFDAEQGKAFFQELLDDIVPLKEHMTMMQLSIDEDGIPKDNILALKIA
jgi:hypothetical protein